MIFPFIHLLVLLIFLNRYVVPGILDLLGLPREPPDTELLPDVTIVVPMFNEGPSIRATIESLLLVDYPVERLRVVVVDDCSRDDSYSHARETAAQHPGRVTVLRNPVNMGKRRSINRAVVEATSEVIVSVDSDVVVAPDAIRKLVCKFSSPEVVAVGGRVRVWNANDNWLTQMQTIKYFFGYEYMKSLERKFMTVMCLSGCLTAYRRTALLEVHDILLTRNVAGVPIKYGEDRFLTRQLVRRGWRTTMNLDAVCFTKAPATMSAYFAQQIRWRRSNVIDYAAGMTHAWKLPPVVGVHYMTQAALLVAYPMVVLQHMRSGNFMALAALHVGVLAVSAAVYWLHSLRAPIEQRVNPVSFLEMAVVMPATYVALTPLAAFTLDTGSWETRGYQASVPAADASDGRSRQREIAPIASLGRPSEGALGDAALGRG